MKIIERMRKNLAWWLVGDLIEKLESDQHHLEGEVDDLQTEAEKLDIEVTDLETELNELSEKFHDLRDEVNQTEIPDGDKIEADIDGLSDRIAALDRKVRDLA